MRKSLKLLIIALAVCNMSLFGLVFAQTSTNWVTANQKVVGWDAVTTNVEGDPIPAEDTVTYTAYLANAITDPNKSNPVEIGENITDPQFTVTLNVEGKFYFGVKSVRKSSDGEIVGESDVVWSDDPAVVDNNATFGIRHYLPPAAPSGLTTG